MTCSTHLNEIIEDRYQLCISLYLIKKETDKRNKEKRKRGEKNLVYVDIFALPSHIKKLFGDFLKIPQYTQIGSLFGRRTRGVNCITIRKNKLYSGNGFSPHILIKGPVCEGEKKTFYFDIFNIISIKIVIYILIFRMLLFYNSHFEFLQIPQYLWLPFWTFFKIKVYPAPVVFPS